VGDIAPVQKLGYSTKEAIAAIGSEKLFLRAQAAGWIQPHVSTGPGGVSLYSLPDLLALWERLGKEVPPLLPCEQAGKKSN
jgi:hypothetical protein